jgi:hypothetical protein
MKVNDIVADSDLSPYPLKAKVIYVSETEIITQERTGLKCKYKPSEFKFLKKIDHDNI